MAYSTTNTTGPKWMETYERNTEQPGPEQPAQEGNGKRGFYGPDADTSSCDSDRFGVLDDVQRWSSAMTRLTIC